MAQLKITVRSKSLKLTMMKASFGVNAEFLNFNEAVSKKDKSLYLGTPRTAFHHLACVDAFLKSSAKNGDHVKIQQP